VTVKAEGADPLAGFTLNQEVSTKAVKLPEPVTFSVCVIADPPDCAEKLSGFLSTPSVWAWSAADAQDSITIQVVGESSFFKSYLQTTWAIGYKRPVFGNLEKFQADPHWRDLLLFHEYFHGDSGAGVGASHQTGWTGVVTKLMQQSGESREHKKTAADRVATD